MTEHEALRGPTRGQFKVCYCTAPCCRRVVDGRSVCICAGCRAVPECAGNQAVSDG